jgi:AcrR family transcriptional regulator
VLVERGAESFNLAEVARRAGVQRASLYRRYGTASRLLRELGAAVAGEDIPIPDTGSLRGDLLQLLSTARSLLASPVGRALAARSLIARTPVENEERRVFWRRRQALLGTVLRRAVERGEIPSDLPIQLAIGMVVGPLWFRLFVTDQPVGAREIRVLADLMTAALTKKTPRARSSR